jgi:hypothetical protein
VTRSGPVTAALTVNFAVTGTAASGSDYAGIGTSVTIPVGAASAVITVTPVNDTAVESDETVIVTLSASAEYTVVDPAAATVTITSDDGTPATVQLSAATFSVGESGPTATITATRSGGSSGGCGVSYATANGTAIAGSDYTAVSGTLAWADGDTSNKSFTVPIANDLLDEADETFAVTLSAPTGVAALGTPNGGTVTITDNDPIPTVQFFQAASSGLESTTPAWIFVSLSAPSGRTVTVDYATADGTATAGSDYTATSGTLTFFPGAPAHIEVPIAGDPGQEPTEAFTVTLTAPVNATLGTIVQHTYSIYDDGVPGLGGLNALAKAVDQPAWEFTSPTSEDWWWQAAVAHDGVDAARSGTVADGQASSFETTGSFGAGSVTFWWKVSSEPGFDYLRFFIDGVIQDAIAGEVDWEQQSYPLTAGAHTLKWEYAKDGSYISGIDAAWVDQVELPAALVLWTRGDEGQADLRAAHPGTTSGAVPATGWTSQAVPSGEGGPWEATSCARVDAGTDYLLWTRGDTGQAILAKLNPAAAPGVSPVASWAYLKGPAGVGGPWQATGYTHVDATTGYVLWTRGDTGQAILWRVVPGDVSGTIPVASWAHLKAPSGVGGPWQATSYAHVDASEGYVLWTRGDTGQAILWRVVPGDVSGTIPVASWAHLKAPSGVGGPWQATSYTHVDASEGYVLWTRGDTGQAVLWQVAPGAVSGTIPVTSWADVSSAAGAGGPWRATGYVHGATPGTPARDAAPLDEVLTEPQPGEMLRAVSDGQ